MRLKYILIKMSVVNYNKHFLVGYIAVKNIYITRDADNTDARVLFFYENVFFVIIFPLKAKHKRGIKLRLYTNIV